MGLETATHINDLNIANPLGSDSKAQGDDHIRLVKDVLKRDLPLTTASTELGRNLLTSAAPENARTFIGASNTPFRNRVINGDMAVVNRLITPIIAGDPLAYTLCDRFFAYCTGANVNVTRTTASNEYLLQLVATTVGNTGALIGTRISQGNIQDLADKAVTLSVLLGTVSGALTVTYSIYHANGTDNFGSIAAPNKTLITSGTFAATATLTRFVANFTLPSSASNGVEIVFSVAVAPVSGSGTEFRIGAVQLERGTVSLSNIAFENVDYALQLMRCQYYYRKVNASVRGPASAAGQTFDTSLNWNQMNRAPTASIVTAGSLSPNAINNGIVAISNVGGRFSIISTAAGDCYSLDNAYAIDAEMYL